MSSVLDVRRKFITGEISGSEYDDAIDKLSSVEDNICIEGKIFNLVIRKLPEDALNSDMLFSVVDNLLMCNWNDEDERHIVAYEIDVIVRSHSIVPP